MTRKDSGETARFRSIEARIDSLSRSSHEFRQFLNSIEAETMSADKQPTPKTFEQLSVFNLDRGSSEICRSLRQLDLPDVAFSMALGTGGALLSSAGLRDLFQDFHDGKYLEQYAGWLGGDSYIERLKSKMPLDKVPGRSMYGGFWHRHLYGHDILNPMESWKSMKEHCGGAIGAAFGFLIHLVGDSFSSEGLPLPGSSWAREAIKEFSGRNIDTYTQLFTIKARDITGTALVSLVLGRYLKWRHAREKCASYAGYQVSALAHGVAVGVGCSLGSLNWTSAVAVVKNLGQLLLHSQQVGRLLDERERCLLQALTIPPQVGPSLWDSLEKVEGLDLEAISMDEKEGRRVAMKTGLKLLTGGGDDQ